jgi:hypothetical protein
VCLWVLLRLCRLCADDEEEEGVGMDFGFWRGVQCVSSFSYFNFFVWWTSHRYTPAMQVFRMSIIEMLCNSMQCSYPVFWLPC